MNNTSAPTTIYDLYKDAGVNTRLVVLNGAKGLAAFVGLLLNLNLIWVTYKNRSLHGSCNYCIALNSLCNVAYLASHVGDILVFVTGINFIELWMCSYFLYIPVAGLTGSYVASFFIAFDRVLSILRPTWQHYQNSVCYVAILCGVTLMYGLFMDYLMLLAVINDPHKPLMCYAADIYNLPMGPLVQKINMCVCFMTFGSYIILWIALKIAMRRHFGNNVRSTQRIFKALVAILVFELITWYHTGIVKIFLGQIKFSANLETNYTIGVLTCFVSIVTGGNAPILYFFSSEYRKAFKEQFSSAIFCKVKSSKSRSMSSIQTVSINRSVASIRSISVPIITETKSSEKKNHLWH
ncbi:serpentine type 7TM GPCR chemoreceptor srsx domain-containing protein [Ditylenchus destructor]|uniref:Serpentine type 7TM GPCR chemoreceptor srsx domain-containing protein n=1 Tax=Ditylenchus destructor TaxID=166010 RepID=A0AAD4MR10_9BILA|nr:serpentine type 7TM GPCR chemoreceptor srsx domain-containing protein [Ditylenchus destructor]